MSALHTLFTQVADAVRLRHGTLDALVRETEAVPRAVRLGVYQQAYLLRLDEALRANYPKLHLLLGDEDFFELACTYAERHPSRRPSIRWFGDRLADFLASTEPYAGVPTLAELARFEWALCLAFDAADAATLGIDALASLGDEQWPVLRPGFHPAFSVLPLHFNAPAIWRALDRDEAPPAPEQSAHVWAVWRHGMQPHYRSLADDEAALIQALLGGQPFGTACEALLPWHGEDEAPARAAGLLGQWLAAGWVCGLGVGETTLNTR